MKSPWASFWRLALAAAVSIVLFVMIVTVIQQPAAASTRTYQAEFTDVSGTARGIGCTR